jgi:multidrug transporter EmrE-like cation transporter
MKTGANRISQPGLLGMVTNLPLMGGYCLYGLSTLLLVLALKDGELSLLYPVIALTYVWVTVLSFLIFHDDINPWKVLGIVLIVSGVAVLGKGGRR